MSAVHEQFVLRTTLTSPFGRKVRIGIDVLGLNERVTIAHADTANPHDTLREQNPLGKIPCLVRENGEAVYDSGVILEFLQVVADTDRLLPTRGVERIAMLVRTRLADGIIDAGALLIYEDRYHEPTQRSHVWAEHQRGKIRRALDAFEASPPDPRTTDALSIGLACALAFLDRRKVAEWRDRCPALCAWLDTFVASEPAFLRTRPPDT